jgi:hypothetical protein
VVQRHWRPTARIPGAGARAEGQEVRVSADVEGAGAVTLVDSAGGRHTLERRGNLATLRGPVPAGGAYLELPGALPFPVCIPVAGPVTVADAGWPAGAGLDETFAALEALGRVRRVPWANATWQPAATPPPGPPRLTGFRRVCAGRDACRLPERPGRPDGGGARPRG